MVLCDEVFLDADHSSCDAGQQPISLKTTRRVTRDGRIDRNGTLYSNSPVTEVISEDNRSLIYIKPGTRRVGLLWNPQKLGNFQYTV